MWFEQEAAAAHLEQVRTDLVHELVAGLAGGQPVGSGPSRWARHGAVESEEPHRRERPRRPGRGSLAWLLRRRETSYPGAHATAHAGGLA